MRCPSVSVVRHRRLPWNPWNASPPCSTRPPGAIGAPAWSRASLRWPPSPAPSSFSSSPCRCSASARSTSSRSSRSPSCGGRASGSASRSPRCWRSTGSSCRPIHTFTLADSRNWLALAVFVVTAVVVSELAARSRRRATESELLAGSRPRSWLAARCAASSSGSPPRSPRVLQVDRARIELGEGTPGGTARYPLVAGARRVGVIHLDDPAPRDGRPAAADPGARVAARRGRRPRAPGRARRSTRRRSGGPTP